MAEFYLRIALILMLFSLWAMIKLAEFTIHHYGLSESIDSGLISGIGGAIGGLLGGVVAFGVAKSQLSQEKEKEQDAIMLGYLNILQAMLTELKHNQRIVGLILSKPAQKEDYFKLFEDEIWIQVRFDANNLLPADLFDVLDESYREFRDLRHGAVEYRDQPVDYKLRIQVIGKLVEDLTKLRNGLNSAPEVSVSKYAGKAI